MKGYYALGKHVIWLALKINDYKNFYHYDVRYDNHVKKEGGWFKPKDHMSNKNLNLLDNKKILFTYLYNSNYSNKIKNMTKNELLTCDLVIGKLFRKSFMI